MCTKENAWLALKVLSLAVVVYLIFEFVMLPLQAQLQNASPATPSVPRTPRSPSSAPTWWKEEEEYWVYHAPQRAPRSGGALLVSLKRYD